MMRRRAWMVMALVMGAGILAEPVMAQPNRRMEMEQRLRQRFGQLVRGHLRITAEEQERMGEVFRQSQQERRALLARERGLRERLRTRVDLDPRRSAPLLTEEEAAEVLAEMNAIREEELRLFRLEQERLLDFLTPQQVVRFYALREQLDERIRRIRGQGPPGGRRGPGGGPGGGLPGGGPPGSPSR